MLLASILLALAWAALQGSISLSNLIGGYAISWAILALLTRGGVLPPTFTGKALGAVGVVGLGAGIFALGWLEIDPDPRTYDNLVEKLCEAVVIISLMGAGLALDRPVGRKLAQLLGLPFRGLEVDRSGAMPGLRWQALDARISDSRWSRYRSSTWVMWRALRSSAMPASVDWSASRSAAASPASWPRTGAAIASRATDTPKAPQTARQRAGKPGQRRGPREGPEAREVHAREQQPKQAAADRNFEEKEEDAAGAGRADVWSSFCVHAKKGDFTMLSTRGTISPPT